MSLQPYLQALRRRWPWLAAVPLLVLIVSAAAAALAPARYGTSMQLLVTRDPQAGGAAGLSDRAEDTTAQDLPAIVQGSTFRADLAAEQARGGLATNVQLAASFREHTVALAAEAATPEAASAALVAALALLQSNGLRYWGDTTVTPAQPGLHIAVLAEPTQPARLNGPRAQALELALRTLLGLGAAAGLAILPGLRRPE